MPTVTLGKGSVASLDLVLSQGATNVYKVFYSAGDPPVAVNLTGWTARAQLRRSSASADAWLTLSSGSGIVLGSDGSIVLTVAYSATEGDDWDERDTGVWDLELTSPSGTRTRLLQGAVTVSHEVTRA